ncbi:MAG TPA: ATP-binding protein [Vicinamibacterales bacterium]|nr:ATP-binding protein [Vicinamibacterales bacterium]
MQMLPDDASTAPDGTAQGFGAAHPLRSTLDHLLEGFQVISYDWTYLYVNPAAARHGRRTPEELHGRKMWDAYPGIQDTPLFSILSRAMRERTAVTFENQFTFPDQSTRWFELRIVPVPEGICVHSIDIQARKDAMTALRRLNEALDGQVAARMQQLGALNEELEAFSYSVSHELRAPVEAMKMAAGELLARAESLDPDTRHCAEKVAASSDRMRQLIDDLLAFSRIGREPLRRRPTKLADVVEAARKQNEAAERGRDVRWSIGPLPEVEGDPALLQVVFSNLLSNALKFTRGRNPARIDISAQSDEVVGEVVVTVRDNGVGFDPAAASKLFGVFQRLHGDAFEGSGIGLATARRILARHGGRIWAHGAPDSGAEFHCALPAR